MPTSKFGGVPVDETQDIAPVSKFGGVPVGTTPDAAQEKPITQPTATIGPRPQGNSFQRAGDYLGNVVSDIRYGNQETAPGRIIHGLGAKGTTYGEPEAVGEYMASPIIGPLRIGQGAAQFGSPRSSEEMLTGAKNIGGGALQASQIPTSFVAPEAMNEAPQIRNPFPNRASAGRNFDAVERVVGNEPVNMSGPAQIAGEAKRLEALGHSGSPIINKFAKQVEIPPQAPPGKGPIQGPPAIRNLPYRDSRELASAAGNPAVADKLATDPRIQSKIGELAKALDSANRDVAVNAGMGQQYDAAMKEYRQASQLREGLKTGAKVGAGLMGTGVAAQLARKYMFGK